eukprot:5838440-Pyramimonas_sp.AAC.1
MVFTMRRRRQHHTAHHPGLRLRLLSKTIFFLCKLLGTTCSPARPPAARGPARLCSVSPIRASRGPPSL